MNGRKLAERYKAEAFERLEPLVPRLQALQAEGLSVRQIMAKLNAEGVPSPGGKAWHIASVHRALGRLSA